MAAVAQICRRLDGLPLALELAAARTGLLSPRQIADRLDDRFRLLVGGRRDAPARQQTLHATLDWSYDLLVPEEQAAFRALAVFPADFELGAATAICAVGDATLDLLDRLVETSLVRTVDQGGQRRFRLLETLRAYGREKLAEVGETPTALQRHAEHLLLVAEAASERYSSVTDTRWLNWLRQERTNLIAAVAWFCDSEQPAEALRLLNASFRVWSFYGGAAEGDRWLQRLWPRLGVVPVAVRSRSIYIAAFLAREVGDLERAHRLLEPVDALFREVGDDDGLAAALNLRAILAYESGDDEGARLGHEQGLAQARARGDRRVEALHLTNLALAQLALERFDEARASATAALEISRQCADEFAVAVCLATLGGIAYGTDDLERAVALYRQARLAAERIGYSRLLAVLDDRLSHCERRFGDLGASAALLRHSLATSVETDAHTGIAEAATSAAILAVDAGRLADAALLWALAADLLERLRASVVSIYRADFARTEQVVLADAGAADLSRLRASAHQTSWDDAARAIGASLDALHEAVGETTATAALRQPARDSAASPLTEREREVLRLLAAGRSNKEIAAALVLSVRTVERHIENIYAKTGAHGRAAATQFALSHAIR